MGEPLIARISMTPEFAPGDLPPAGYLAWQEWARVQAAAGLRQARCAWCGLLHFPQEARECAATRYGVEGVTDA